MIALELLPIQERLDDNIAFLNHPDCQESLTLSIYYFLKIGYHVPWIGYYAQVNNQLVGAAAFKGKPKNGRVEIAYSTFPNHQHKGIGTALCRQLVELALETDPTVIITARTLPAENHSTRILRKNNFQWNGMVMDEDDGEVWEWEYQPLRNSH